MQLYLFLIILHIMNVYIPLVLLEDLCLENEVDIALGLTLFCFWYKVNETFRALNLKHLLILLQAVEVDWWQLFSTLE